jgi:hypothetical protein
MYRQTRRCCNGHNYAEATERSAMDGGDNGAQGFPLSAYYCIPLQLLPTKFLSLMKIIMWLLQLTFL